MAKRLGISQPTLNRLESGSQNTLGQLCRALRCGVGDLFETGPVNPTERRRRWGSLTLKSRGIALCKKICDGGS